MRNPIFADWIGPEVRAAIFKPLPPIPPMSPAYERVAKLLRAELTNYQIALHPLMQVNSK